MLVNAHERSQGSRAGRWSMLAAQLMLVGFAVVGLIRGTDWDRLGVGFDTGQISSKGYGQPGSRDLHDLWTNIDIAIADPLPLADRAALDRAEGLVRRRPADGYAWLALGWLRALADQDEAALDALRTSWKWAPQSRNLSLRRVMLASLMWPKLSAMDRQRAVAELRLARQSDGAAFRTLVETDARLSALWRIARGQRLDIGHVPLRAAPNEG